jgi:hypothetical protein
MKQMEWLGKKLSKKEQRNIVGALRFGCHCYFPWQAGPCWFINYNQPCGQPGQYVICEAVCPGQGD